MKKQLLKLSFVALCFSVVLLLCKVNNLSAKTKSEKPLLQVKILPAGKISGSFTENGRTIYFETQKGLANPDDDPDAPPFELDIRIMDGRRAPFMVQTAGHRPMEEKWYEEQKAFENTPINEEERSTDFSMLPSMIKSLKSYNKKHKRTRWEIKEIIKLLMSVVNENVFDETDDSFTENQVQEKATMASSSFDHQVTIRKKKAFGIIFEHSAIRLRIYKTYGSLLLQHSTCNHGTCATSTSMSSKCTKTFTKSNLTIYLWDLMCDYWGYPYGSHLCNGDTYQEYLSVKNGQSIDWGVCGTARLYAPDCD